MDLPDSTFIHEPLAKTQCVSFLWNLVVGLRYHGRCSTMSSNLPKTPSEPEFSGTSEAVRALTWV